MAMKGRAELLAKLKAIQGAPRRAARAALEESARQVVSTAKSLAPKKSGALVASIGYTFGDYRPDNANVRGVGAGRGGDPDLTVTIHAGSAKAFYASYIEFGTSPHDAGGKFKGAKHPGATAQPFFFPAFRAHKKSAKGRVSRAVKKAIKDSL